MLLVRVWWVFIGVYMLAGCGGSGGGSNAEGTGANPTNLPALTQSSPQSIPDSSFDPVTDTALNYLNDLRGYVQLPAYVENATLLQSANAHVDYALHHNVIGHNENPANTLYFTGVAPHDRTKAAGYLWPGVSENISYNKANFVGLIDDLMTAVYHRMSLLDFEKDEIGIAYKQVAVPNREQDPYWSALVTNAGVSGLNALCNAGGDGGQSRYVLCDNGAKISITRYQSELDNLTQKSPDMVVWPAANSTVPPVFYDETPDPLPDCSVSGNPISVQINPAKLADYTLYPDTFKLVEKETATPVELNRILSSKTNQPDAEAADWKTDEKQWFAAFPQQRLKWQTLYEASFDYLYGSQRKTKTWQFTTPVVADKLVTLNQNAEMDYQLGETLTVYVPPANCGITGNQWGTNYQYAETAAPDVNIENIDSQTFKIVARQVSQLTLTFTQTDQNKQQYIKTLKLNVR